MAKWSGKDRTFSPALGREDWKWDFGLDPHRLQNSFSPLSEFDLWEKALFKSRGAELRTALEESSMRRAELVQRLREAHGRLDNQTDILKAKETQLQHSQSTTQLLELKQKQLAKTLRALEEEKEAVELNHFEERHRRGELQEKVVQLEMDLLRMKSSLERTNTDESPTSQTNPQLNKTMPVTKEDFLREEQKHTVKEVKNLKEAVRKAEERAKSMETEKDHALKQLYFSKEGLHKRLNQAEELKQKLSTSMQAQNELQDQLSESRSRLGQLELEKDLLYTKALRLEDSLEDLKAKLSAALADKDRLVQEKADLHQRTQSLKLQLQRAQLGREGFTEQVCELHSELTQVKSQASRQQQNSLLMKEELHSAKEVNEKLSTELAEATERLQVTLKQLHELEAESLFHTNQIAALESERLQLIGEKEEMMDVFDEGNEEELRKLRERCFQLRELQENLEREMQDLQTHCQGLEKKVQNMEVEHGCKEEELKRLELELEQKKEELEKVAAHWNERWLDVAMTLQVTQAELEEMKNRQKEADALREEASGMASTVETLNTQLKDSQDQIQSLLEQKTRLEKELCRVKKDAGALERLELDACRQQLDLERSRSQNLQQRLMGNPVSLEEMDGELVQLRAELQKVWDMLKTRDTELEERQQELQSALCQVTQQNSEVRRLEQQLAERDQELKERDLTVKNLKSQRETKNTEAQYKISALEKELTGLKLCDDKQDTQATNSQKSEMEAESRETAEQMKQEGARALQRVHTPKSPQQGKEQKTSATVIRKEKSVGADHIDPDQQRRLITEQLKSLFKEREQLGDKASPVLQRRVIPKSKACENTEDTLSSNRTRQLDGIVQDLGVQQGAGKSSVDNAKEAQSAPLASENGLQGQLNHEGSHRDTQQMSALSVEMEELKDRNENLLKAKLKFQQQIQDLRGRESWSEDTFCMQGINNVEEEASHMRPPQSCVEGTFLARQVEVCDSEMEDEVLD